MNPQRAGGEEQLNACVERKSTLCDEPAKASNAAKAKAVLKTREPLPYSLRCQTVADEKLHHVLWWHSTMDAVPFDVESGLIDVLVPKKKKERGMFCVQPKHRLRKIERICQSQHVPLHTALSLRRHHMRRYNPRMGMHHLNLGVYNDIRKSAELFELAVQDFLTREQVEFYTETEQKAYVEKHRPAGQPFPLTPDFILKKPIRIKCYTKGKGNERRVTHERSVQWIEVKMFYGASTIEQDGKSAVGDLYGKTKKYVQTHGAGAVVFMHGYGDNLASMLDSIGAMALDASCRDSISLERVEAHQRTWCADKDGNILP